MPGNLRRAEIRPGDKLVISFRDFRHIGPEDVEVIKEQVSGVLGVKPDDILIIAGADLTVVSGSG